MTENLFTIEDTCPVCGEKFMTDGYLWTCSRCQHSAQPCKCGSDDVSLDWSVIPGVVWLVECHVCERTTAPHIDPKSALAAWNNGEQLTLIHGTDHFEEAW